jgi:hypothetical protein
VCFVDGEASPARISNELPDPPNPWVASASGFFDADEVVVTGVTIGLLIWTSRLEGDTKMDVGAGPGVDAKVKVFPLNMSSVTMVGGRGLVV